jgi:hypothetical protein
MKSVEKEVAGKLRTSRWTGSRPKKSAGHQTVTKKESAQKGMIRRPKSAVDFNFERGGLKRERGKKGN